MAIANGCNASTSGKYNINLYMQNDARLETIDSIGHTKQKSGGGFGVTDGDVEQCECLLSDTHTRKTIVVDCPGSEEVRKPTHLKETSITSAYNVLTDYTKLCVFLLPAWIILIISVAQVAIYYVGGEQLRRDMALVVCCKKMANFSIANDPALALVGTESGSDFVDNVDNIGSLRSELADPQQHQVRRERLKLIDPCHIDDSNVNYNCHNVQVTIALSSASSMTQSTGRRLFQSLREKHLTYMLAHKDQTHLWCNILGQLVLAILLCVDTHKFANLDGSGRPSWIDATFKTCKLLIAYFISGLVGAIVFEHDVATDILPVKSIVGSSAGVFGLCGLLLVDFICDFATLLQESHNFKCCVSLARGLIIGFLVSTDLYEIFTLYYHYHEEVKISLQRQQFRRNQFEAFQVHFWGMLTGLVVGIAALVVKLIQHFVIVTTKYLVRYLSTKQKYEDES